nr:hypothetical protein [uncultured bacterium]
MAGTVNVALDRRTSWGWGAGVAVLFAVVVAACSLGADVDPASLESNQSVERGVPSSDAAPSADDGTTSESTPAPTSTVALPTETSVGPAEVTFSQHIEPIITETCASCHTGDGPGTQHVRFDTAAKVSRAAFAIAIVTEERFMPPWPAGDASVPFDHDWSLTDEEIAAILEWDDDGAPLDVDPEKEMIPVNGVVGIDEPDLVVPANGSYDGEFGQPDEYRCFVYDPEVTDAAFVSEMEFIPQQTQVVHHAVGFLVGEQDRAAIAELEGADGQGGWTCFGFSPGRSAELVFTWAPGTDPTVFPTGTGLEMEPGDFFVMQTHYHYDVEADADQSTMAIKWVAGEDVDPVNLSTYLAPAEIPCAEAEVGPLCDRSAARQRAIDAYGNAGVLADLLVAGCGDPLDAPDGFVDGVAKSTCTWPVLNPGEIVSVFGHEHEIGATFRLTINPDTPDEIVLLDIPKWDFDWQFIYEPTDSIVIGRGDTIRVECTWDRALRDPELEPAYVLWADGTDDEMCFSTIVTRPA